MNVLSLFDGISCGRLALERAGIEVENYFASEIEKPAIQIAQKNFPDIFQVGDVTNLKYYRGAILSPGSIKYVGKIDLLIGGSPCQSFSIAGNGLGFDGKSKLFFEYLRLLDEIRADNPDVKFLLENVRMKQEWADIITKYLGVEPILINSALVSGQNRERFYWTNIEGVAQPEDKGVRLIDILEDEVADEYYHSEAAIAYMDREVKGGRTHWDFAHHCDTAMEKSRCITANFHKGVPYNVLIDRRQVNQISPVTSLESTNQPKMQHRIYHTEGKSVALTSFAGRMSIYPDKQGLIRKLTPIECERLQTLPDNYTKGIANTHRYKAIGNGWNADTIAHIFLSLKSNH